MNKPNPISAGASDAAVRAALPTAIKKWRRRAGFLRQEGYVAMAGYDWQTIALANVVRSMQDRQDWGHAWHTRAVAGLKYLLRLATMPLRHARFLAFVHGSAPMRACRQRDARLLERHLHRYVNVHWHRRDRLDGIMQHYRFALAQFPRGLFNEVYARGHASLGMLVAKDGSLLGLCLRPPIFKGCEGELCLQLNDVDGHALYRIVFSIVGKQRPRIVIGCLQGPGGDHAREAVRALTRNLHGLRPKHLMLALVYAFARHYGIREIDAISNQAHPLRASGHGLHADYDAFWEEQHGRRIDDGWYALPCAMPHKAEAEVSSHHRSAFRRREALRRQAENLLQQALGVPAPEAAPRQEAAVRRQVSADFLAQSSWVS